MDAVTWATPRRKRRFFFFLVHLCARGEHAKGKESASPFLPLCARVLEIYKELAPVVQTLDSAIHRIIH